MRDLTRDGRLSTDDESILITQAVQKVSFWEKCARMGNPLKLPTKLALLHGKDKMPEI